MACRCQANLRRMGSLGHDHGDSAKIRRDVAKLLLLLLLLLGCLLAAHRGIEGIDGIDASWALSRADAQDQTDLHTCT